MLDIRQTTEDPKVFCNPDEAIPLHYEPIRKKKSDTSKPPSSQDTGPESHYDPVSANQSTLWKSGALPRNSWHILSKTLLLRKAAIAYRGLAEAQLRLQNFTACLQYVKNGLKCFGRCAMCGKFHVSISSCIIYSDKHQ